MTLVADDAQELAESELAEAASAREYASRLLAEAEDAKAAAVEERRQAEDARKNAAKEAEDVGSAKLMLQARVGAHVSAQARAAAAREAAVAAARVAEGVAEASTAVLLRLSDEHNEEEDEEEEVEYEEIEPDDDDSDPESEDEDSGGEEFGEKMAKKKRRRRLPPVLAREGGMRAFVTELLDDGMESMCLPEVTPGEFSDQVRVALTGCLEFCTEALGLMEFDASAEMPTRSHEIAGFRTDFGRLRAVIEQRMLNGLWHLAQKQLADYELTDCIASCDEVAVLSEGRMAHMRRWRFRAHREVAAYRVSAVHKTRALVLMASGVEQLRLKDARAAITLSEALTLDPENPEIVRLKAEAVGFATKQRELGAEQQRIEQAHKDAAKAREKVKKAAQGGTWLDDAQKRAKKRLEQADAVEEEAKQLSDPAYAAGAKAATAAGWAGPAGVTAARTAAEQAYMAAAKTFEEAEAAEKAADAAGKAGMYITSPYTA